MPNEAVINYSSDIVVKIRHNQEVSVELTSQGPQGPQGPQGERGATGDVTPEAQLARDQAQAARDAAEAARAQTLQARADAQLARDATGAFAANAAQSAANAAQSAANAAQFDPSLYPTKENNGSDFTDSAQFRINIGAAAALNDIAQAEAEAGLATTARNWNALRVRQAVAAYAAPIEHSHVVEDIADLETILDGKASLVSPEFSGIATVPTAELGAASLQIANTEFVKNTFDAFIGSAPGTLDTIYEIAEALGNDPNAFTTLTNQIAGKADFNHGHAIAGITGLEAALAAKAPLASPAFMGNPTAVTQSVNDSSTRLATTAHVKATIAASGLSVEGHSHVIADINGLQAALNAKLGSGLTSLVLQNPGIGNASRVEFSKSNDRAGIEVTEYAADKTSYVFYMADNPDSADDYFQWRVTDWKGAAGTWIPLDFRNLRARIDAIETEYYGGVTIDNSARIQSGGEIGGYARMNGAPAIVIDALALTGGSRYLYHCVVTASGTIKTYSGTGASKISELGGDGTANAVSEFMPNGTAQTIHGTSGVKVTFPTSGLTAGMYWMFSAWPSRVFRVKGDAIFDQGVSIPTVTIGDNSNLAASTAFVTNAVADGISGKANVNHTHGAADITDLQGLLDQKAAVGHIHAVGDVTGLAAALSTLAPLNHLHGIPEINGLSEILNQISQRTVPPGVVEMYGGTALPAGWLWCDGAVYERAEYPELFAAIGTAFGAPTETTFRTPRTNGLFPRGVDNGAGADPDAANRLPAALGGNSGDAVGSVQGDAIGSHEHNANFSGEIGTLGVSAKLNAKDEFGVPLITPNAYLGKPPTSGIQAANVYVPSTSTGADVELSGLDVQLTGEPAGTIAVQAYGGAETRSANIAFNFIIKT